MNSSESQNLVKMSGNNPGSTPAPVVSPTYPTSGSILTLGDARSDEQLVYADFATGKATLIPSERLIGRRAKWDSGNEMGVYIPVDHGSNVRGGGSFSLAFYPAVPH